MGKKRVKDIHVINKVMPHLMPRRTDSEIFLTYKLDVTKLMEYLEQRNKKLPDDEHATIFHALATASAKMIFHRPFLNRYVKARKTYQRDEITVAFVSRREFKDNSDELLVQIKIGENDTMAEIGKKIIGKVSAARKNDNGMDSFLKTVMSLPTPIVAIIMALFRFADYFQFLPKSFTKSEPDFATVYLANLGSIKGNAVCHHLNNFGTNSLFATMGLVHKEEMIIDDKEQVCDVLELGITIDERISDGFKAFRALGLLKDIVAHPETLDEPIKKEVKL